MPNGKKILVALPDAMLLEIDFIAKAEHRNRSELIRECIRFYTHKFRLNQKEYTKAPPTDVSCVASPSNNDHGE